MRSKHGSDKFDWAVLKTTVELGEPEQGIRFWTISERDEALKELGGLKGVEAEVAGYPTKVDGKNVCEMYTGKGKILNYTLEGTIDYDINTSGGNTTKAISKEIIDAINGFK